MKNIKCSMHFWTKYLLVYNITLFFTFFIVYYCIIILSIFITKLDLLEEWQISKSTLILYCLGFYLSLLMIIINVNIWAQVWNSPVRRKELIVQTQNLNFKCDHDLLGFTATAKYLHFIPLLTQILFLLLCRCCCYIKFA
jgi:hypothetical protein